MEVVINISKKTYDLIKHNVQAQSAFETAYYAIQRGTVLPEGHGRLIDADALKLTQHDIHVESINYRHRCISVENVDEAQTVIEADKEGVKE